MDVCALKAWRAVALFSSTRGCSDSHMFASPKSDDRIGPCSASSMLRAPTHAGWASYAGVGGAIFGSFAALYGRLTRVDRKLQQHSRDAAVAAMPLLSNRRGMRLKTGTLMLQAGSYLHALREFFTPRAMRCLILARKSLPAAQRVHRRREWLALTWLWRLSLRL